MLRFTVRDVLWLTAVVAMAVGWWLQAVKYRALASEHKALQRRFDGMVEIITSTGLIAITKTSPIEYRIDTGPVAKDLWKRVGQTSSAPVADPN